MTGRIEKLIHARRMLAAARRLEQNMFDVLIQAIDTGEDEALINVARQSLGVKQRRIFSSCQREMFPEIFTKALATIGSAKISWTLKFN